jgi:hypothetical protein
MAQRLLRHAQVSPLPHHVGSEGVPEGVDGRSCDVRRPHELVDDALNASRGEARPASRGEDGRAFLGVGTRRQVSRKRLACPRVEGDGTFLSALPTHVERADRWQTLRLGQPDIVSGQGRGFG